MTKLSYEEKADFVRRVRSAKGLEGTIKRTNTVSKQQAEAMKEWSVAVAEYVTAKGEARHAAWDRTARAITIKTMGV